MLERKPNSQNEELPFNKYLVIMLIFKPHNQSKTNPISMEFIKGLGNGENGGMLASPFDLI